jgi:hypothetical protein
MSGKLISMHVKPSLSHHAKEKVNIDDLSEEEFMRIYKTDPFFRERVNVEIEKIEKTTGPHGIRFTLDEECPE